MVRQRSCRGSTRFASCFIHSTPSGEDAIKGRTPLELMTVGESTPDGEGGVDVVVRGSGAVMGALRLNIISLDEIRDPGEYEGSFPLSREEDDAGIHIRDYSRDIYVSPAKGLRTTPEGPQG